MTVMFPVIPLYLGLYLTYWRRASTLSPRDPQHWLGLLALLVFSLHWSRAGRDDITTEILAIMAAFWVFQNLQLQRNEVEDEIKIARSRLPVAPGLALPFFQVIEGIVEGSSHSDSER